MPKKTGSLCSINLFKKIFLNRITWEQYIPQHKHKSQQQRVTLWTCRYLFKVSADLNAPSD